MIFYFDETPVCEYCGKEIKRKSHHKGGGLRWCNMDCRKKAQDFKQRTITTCQYCGKPFMEKRERTNLYCSRSCATLAAKQRELYWKQQDDEELKEFEEQERKHRQDLLDKYTELIREAERLRLRIERERPCKECGTIFIGDSKSARYCSDACRKRADNRDHDKRIYRNGQPDLSITLTKVFKRDGGICQICGKRIGFDCDSNSDDYPSIDHILPLAKGGLHQWNNVQLACRGCNTAKGTRYTPACEISS